MTKRKKNVIVTKETLTAEKSSKYLREDATIKEIVAVVNEILKWLKSEK